MIDLDRLRKEVIPYINFELHTALDMIREMGRNEGLKVTIEISDNVKGIQVKGVSSTRNYLD